MFYTSPVVSDHMLELIFRPKIDRWVQQTSTQIVILQDLRKESKFNGDLDTTREAALEKIHKNYIEISEITVCDPAVGHGIFLIRAFHYLVEMFSSMYNTFHELKLLYDLKNKSWFKDCMFWEESTYGRINWAKYIICNLLYGIDIQEASVHYTRVKLLTTFSEWCNSLQYDVNDNQGRHVAQLIASSKKFCQHALKTHLIVANSLIPETWQTHFPDIFTVKGGFSVILCNPPWKMHQMNDLDFFGLYDLQYPGSTPKKRKKIEQNLLQTPEIQEAYIEKISEFKTTNKIYRQNYKLQGEHKFNLYKLFVERILNLLTPRGECGLVVPLGLLGEYRASPLRKKLFATTQISHMYHLFSNAAFFPTITSGQPFCVLIFMNGLSTKKFQYCPHITSEGEFLHPNRIIEFTQDQILRISPTISLNRQKGPSFAIPLVETQKELDLLIFLSKYPRLVHDWGIEVRRELNRTDDMRNGVITTKPGPIPVLEGKHLTHYGFSTSQVQYFINSSIDYPSYRPNFQYPRIVWRNVSNIRLRRRMFCTLIPGGIATVNSLNYIVPFKKLSKNEITTSVPIAHDELLYLLGMLGSLVCEFQLRMFSTNNNLNQYLIENLTIPVYDSQNSLHRVLVHEITEFLPISQCWADKMVLLGNKHIEKQELEKTYLPSLAKIDALCARIYALNSDQMKVLQLKFPKIPDSHFQLMNSFFNSNNA